MPKKYPPGYIKDPKKVAAGKARAAQSLRVEGKFTTNKFLENVKKDAEAKGVKDVFKYYLQHETTYSKLYEKQMITTNRNDQQLKGDLKEYTGKIYKNGREVKKETALKSIAQTNQYLRNEFDVVAWYAKPELSLNGKMNIKVPSPAQIKQRAEDNGIDLDDLTESEFIEFMEDEFGLTAIISKQIN